jgi:nitrite reductase/ring-hydroxylating ferredoxin subunit
MKWYQVEGIEDLNKPFIKKIKAGSKSICIVCCDGEIFALSATCPHAGGDLSYGWCNNGKLICPIHRYSFDLHSGKGSEGQNDYINTYPVKVEGGAVYVGVGGFWERLKQGFNT